MSNPVTNLVTVSATPKRRKVVRFERVAHDWTQRRAVLTCGHDVPFFPDGKSEDRYPKTQDCYPCRRGECVKHDFENVADRHVKCRKCPVEVRG